MIQNIWNLSEIELITNWVNLYFKECIIYKKPASINNKTGFLLDTLI